MNVRDYPILHLDTNERNSTFIAVLYFNSNNWVFNNAYGKKVHQQVRKSTHR